MKKHEYTYKIDQSTCTISYITDSDELLIDTPSGQFTVPAIYMYDLLKQHMRSDSKSAGVARRGFKNNLLKTDL